MTHIKDTILNKLADHPEIGLAGATTGTVMPFIDSITHIAQCIAALAGAAIAIITLIARWRKYRKQNHDTRPPER